MYLTDTYNLMPSSISYMVTYLTNVMVHAVRKEHRGYRKLCGVSHK
jgi:hypothetical protein